MPPVVLQVLLKDQASPGLKTVQAEVHKLGTAGTAAAPGMNALGAATGKASASFLSGAGSALRFAGAMTGMQLGLSGIGSVFQSTIGHVVGFQSAMANVATLGNNSVEVQARLREELLKLPAVLGDSTTLAKGLYDVLSAGIPAADAVAFLGVSASLAKAGLADVNVTTQALTKTMAAFAIPTKDAAQLADVLFKVVDLGQGSLAQFAGAFPQVTQGAAAIGLSFKDTAAAMATLTQTFRNADTAATGFRSLLGQLITNSDKFAERGINIQKVIGEQGLSGVLRVLQELTGGNVEEMRKYVNDIEGLAAAQALTGPQFKLFLENQKKLAESTGTVEKGLKLQGETAQSTYDAMVADAGKAAIALAPPFLLAFTAIAKGARLYAEDVNSAFVSIKPVVVSTTTAATEGWMRLFAAAGKGVENIKKASDGLVQSLDGLVGETERTTEATRHYALGATLAATETDEFKTATAVLAKSLTESTVKLSENESAARTLGAAFKLLGIETTETMQQAATNALSAFKTILDSGQATPQQIVTAWQGAMKDVTEAGFKTLPPGFESLMAQVREIFRKAGVELPKPLRDAFGLVRVEFDATGGAIKEFAHALDLSGISAEAAAANYRKLEPALDAIAGAHAEAAREAAGFGTILQRNIDLADLSLQSTLALNEGIARSSHQESFADDIPGLLAQLKRAQTEFQRVAGAGDPIGDPGFAAFTMKALGESIDAITAKLKTLGMDMAEVTRNPFDQATAGAEALGATLGATTAQADALTASTARLTRQTTAASSAAASAAGNYAKLAAGGIAVSGGQGSAPFGTKLPPGSRGAQPMPLRPGSAPGNQRPPGFNIPGRPLQRFAEGGIVGGTGGVDSQLILATPGERVSTPGQDRAISFSFGGDIVVNVNGSNASSASPEALGDIAAQALVRSLAPRLNESLRRGGGSRFD